MDAWCLMPAEDKIERANFDTRVECSVIFTYSWKRWWWWLTLHRVSNSVNDWLTDWLTGNGGMGYRMNEWKEYKPIKDSAKMKWPNGKLCRRSHHQEQQPVCCYKHNIISSSWPIMVWLFVGERRTSNIVWMDGSMKWVDKWTHSWTESKRKPLPFVCPCCFLILKRLLSLALLVAYLRC